MKQHARPLIANPRAKRPAPRLTRPSGRTLPWLLAIIVVAGAGSAWWWQTRAAVPQDGVAPPRGAASAAANGTGARRFGGANAAQPVAVQRARRQDIRVTVNAIGSMTASNTAVVRPQVSGVLQRVDFREGQPVQAGQLIAQIDPRAFQATLAQAEGTLARDTAQLDAARVDLARYRDLLAKDAIPRQQLDTQEGLVRQLEGTVKSDQGVVANARLQLSYTRIVAPMTGRAGLRQVDAGNMVQPSDANGIVSITQTRPIAMVFALPSANLPLVNAHLRANQPVEVEAFDRAGRQPLAVGRVATLDNAIDPVTDTIKLKALFPNSDDALFPNQSVSVVLELDTLHDALAVPQAAVLRGAQGFYVYVVGDDNTVSTRVVTPGAADGGWVAVSGALQPGERVVTDGTDRLREGARVEVIAADPNQRAGAQPAGGGNGRRARAAGKAASGAGAGPVQAAPGAASRPAAAP